MSHPITICQHLKKLTYATKFCPIHGHMCGSCAKKHKAREAEGCGFIIVGDILSAVRAHEGYKAYTAVGGETHRRKA